MVRSPMGVPLSSPKQPQPASGRRCLISFSAPTATRKNSAVPVRTTLAGRISLGTVKSTVSRAVAKLRIDAELGEDSGA
jgi:hypothetical protein